jgi:toxin ParE1/3/4
VPTIRITAQAVADLERVKRQSIRGWGRRHALGYINGLERRFQFLLERPLLGVPRDDLYPGLRSFPQSVHVIYYLTLDDGIRVVRVMHQRMKAASHLSVLGVQPRHGHAERRKRKTT